jgi:ankyrin repeat protein
VNSYIKAIKALDITSVEQMLSARPDWLTWKEPSGKNALHYLCGIGPSSDPKKNDAALAILKLLLKRGMDIDSVHKIPEKNGHFPATPLWYAYTRGRNEKLYRYLLKKGAKPDNCMWAIAWYDDVPAAKLWLKHGAEIDVKPSLNDLFLGSFQWKKYRFAEWLLKMGADVNAAGPHGLTALMLAVKRKDETGIKLLMRYGADPGRENDLGISARKLAALKGPKRILNLLR